MKKAAVKYQNWHLTEIPADDKKKLASTLNLNSVTAQVLINRGYQDPVSVSRFFNPRLSLLNSPWLLSGMEKAVELIQKNIQNQKKILIFGDYDVDGTTGVSLLFSCLKNFGADVFYYIPHREKEGYGLNAKVITACKKKGFNLIITVDLGIANIEEARLAHSLGLELIITDHHEPGPELPQAEAIINPKISKSPTVFKELSGVGVVFKLVQALSEKMGSFDLENALDLVALGTVADIVPLQDENRILVVEGLKILNSFRRPGLRYLSQLAGLDEVNTREISYMLGPRLNAAGRIDHARTSIELLLAEEEKKACLLAKRLDLLNRERQQIGSFVKEAALENLLLKPNLENEKILIIEAEHWHAGVIGIVASQIAESFQVPVIIITFDGKIGRASGRSFGEINLHNLFKGLENLFINFGGHSQAVGFQIERKNLEILKKELRQRASSLAERELPVLKIDGIAELNEIDSSLLKELENFAPFGEGNEKPVLACCGLKPIDYQIVGKNHLKLAFAEGNTLVEAIGFEMSSELENIKDSPVDLAFVLEENTYSRKNAVQLNLKSIRTAS